MSRLDEAYHQILTNGIEKINSEYKEQNDKYLKISMERGRNCGIDILDNINAFFVPNNEFLLTIFGDIIKEKMFGMYDQAGNCLYLHRVVIPIYNIDNKIIATTAYSPVQTLLSKDIAMLEAKKERTVEEEDKLQEFLGKRVLKYLLPNKERLKLSNHFYAPKGVWDKIFRDDYVVIVDGVFDCIQLNHNGINSLALLGSIVTPTRMFALNMISHVFVFYDNDSSGRGVLKSIENRHRFVVPIRNRKTDDADNYIKTYGVKQLKEEIKFCLEYDITAPIVLTGK